MVDLAIDRFGAIDILVNNAGGPDQMYGADECGHSGVAYTTGKHALVGLSRNVAAMYGADGIRCVAICPGKIATGGTTKLGDMRNGAVLLAESGFSAHGG